MFQSLSEKLGKITHHLSRLKTLSEKNIEEALSQIETSLLDADVAHEVVDTLKATISKKTIGQAVPKGIEPGQWFVKLVNDELTTIMGESNADLNLSARPPAVILMAGLQGAGKTTTSAKLAYKLKNENKKKVLLVSCDVYRPAAIDQLESLAASIDVEFFSNGASNQPLDIAESAIAHARQNQHDVVLVDTAGRLHIDDAMMSEIKTLQDKTQPVETLFVVDSMTGQDAALTAKTFDDQLSLTGVILTKTDGDSRGGAALSVRYLTGKPIKFLGVGEKIEDLSAFFPDRVASRILGMGDILSLIEEAERKIDKKKVKKMLEKTSFDLDDFRDQLKQMQNMGGLGSIMGMLPGMAQMKNTIESQLTEGEAKFAKSIVIIDSMTENERRFPGIINESRKKRIAMGSGTEKKEVSTLLRQHAKMAKMTGKLKKKGGMENMMKQLQGVLPPGSDLHGQ